VFASGRLDLTVSAASVMAVAFPMLFKMVTVEEEEEAAALFANFTA
jgi:hypothetical protein